MPWINDTYFYTPGILKAIARGYVSLYEDGLLLANYRVDYLYAIAEFKADFDMSLSAIGRTKWDSLSSADFGDYRHYGRLQRVVIADILDIPDYKLEGWGFYDIPRLRGTAYSRMVENLNRTMED